MQTLRALRNLVRCTGRVSKVVVLVHLVAVGEDREDGLRVVTTEPGLALHRQCRPTEDGLEPEV